MTAAERVRAARAALWSAIAGASVLWALAAVTAVLALAALLDYSMGLPLALRRAALPVAAAAGLAALVAVVWRGRHARSLPRVALYVEERVPALQFALVTALEHSGDTLGSRLDGVVASTWPAAVMRRPVRRALAWPALAFVAAAAVFAGIPAGSRSRVLAPHAGDALARAAPRSPLASRLVPVVVRIEPPPYARQEGRSIDDPTSVSALVGSTVEIVGRGASALPEQVAATLGADSLRVTADGDMWHVSLRMPPEPSIVRLGDRSYDRLIALEPVIDRPPRVTLEAPRRDSTYPEPRGTLTLDARAEDDIGLASVLFELRHSSGGGERFTTRRWTAGAVTPNGSRAAGIRVVARLDTMHLGPGDVLHVRALAVDGNVVSGPDTAFSDTRTLRIDDPGARDTLRISPSQAPPLDTTALSQRMLIMRAESLLAQKRRLEASAYVRQSVQLGGRQAALRKRVEDVITDLENVPSVGYTGVTQLSLLLHEVANNMRDAETELLVAHPETALPPMRRALGFLEQARQAHRLYLRGILPVEPVDVARARLKGTDSAAVAGRLPRGQAPHPRQVLLERLDRMRVLTGALLLDSLTVLRVDAITAAPDAAETLGAALDALRRGRDASTLLLATRRRLERAATALPALSAWQGVP